MKRLNVFPLCPCLEILSSPVEVQGALRPSVFTHGERGAWHWWSKWGQAFAFAITSFPAIKMFLNLLQHVGIGYVKLSHEASACFHKAGWVGSETHLWLLVSVASVPSTKLCLPPAWRKPWAVAHEWNHNQHLFYGIILILLSHLITYVLKLLNQL